MRKSLLIISLLNFSLFYSQRELRFDYDESGNQVYRGEVLVSKGSSNSVMVMGGMSAEEIEFWKKVSIGPNSTSDFLFVSFNQEAKNNLSKIEMYQQSSLGNRVYAKDLTKVSLLSFTIDMRRYSFGNYVLIFFLKDGNRYSQHILKQ